MQRIVGGIEVEDDLLRRLLVGVEEEIDEQAFDRRRVVADLVIARRFGAAQFQPVQRRFAGQRRTVGPLCLQLAGQHRQHRVMAQVVVVVQVLIAKRDADDALHHHGLDLVLHQLRGACIGEAGGKPLGQPDRPVGLAEQQGAGIRGDRATVEARPPRGGLRRVEIRTMRGYSLSALGRPVDSRKTVAATRFSQNPRPNAPDSVVAVGTRVTPRPPHRSVRAP